MHLQDLPPQDSEIRGKSVTVAEIEPPNGHRGSHGRPSEGRL